MRYLIIFALLLPGTQSVLAQIKFQSFDLDNGLHVIMHRDPATPIVSIGMLYHVGSKNEDPDRTGFAHFFEHLMFEGTENIARGDFMKMIEAAGGDLNAYTAPDHTYYFEVLPSNYLELGLWMEAERMLHAKIDEKGVETQRSVIHEERRYRYENQPYGSLLEELFKRAYSKHPYRWRPAGSEEYIDQATLGEFREFYKTFYVPQNAVLSIAGDIDYQQTRKWVEKYFKDIPRGQKSIPRPQVTEPPHKAEIRDTIYDNIQLPAVVMGYHIPARSDEDYFAVEMLAMLLSGARSARLDKALVDQRQLASGVAALPFDLEDPGLLLIYAVASLGTGTEELEQAMEEEIQKVRDMPIDLQEFSKLQNQMEATWVSSQESVMEIAEALAVNYLYFGDPNLVNTAIERYRKISREDLQRVARQYLVPENRVTLHYLPESQQ